MRLVLVLIFFLSALAVNGSAQISLFIAGDSTAANKADNKRPETGWGEMMQQYFDPAKVKIVNEAQNGRSTKTFISEGRWQSIVDRLKNDDWVFVQFGHNDESKDKGERYTPPEDFRKNLERFVTDVRAKKAHVVLLTPVRRRKFDKDHKLVDTHGEYPDITRAVARSLKVPLIDMHEKTGKLLTTYGDEPSRTLFLQVKAGESPNYPNGVEDNTHFNPKGAGEVAKLVIEGIRENKLALRKYLKK
ncbi:MAG: rhamnogalacturonan acetylesterase [Pyrinomonadaceae bacterium]